MIAISEGSLLHQFNHMTVPYSQISFFMETQDGGRRSNSLIRPKKYEYRVVILYLIPYVNSRRIHNFHEEIVSPWDRNVNSSEYLFPN